MLLLTRVTLARVVLAVPLLIACSASGAHAQATDSGVPAPTQDADSGVPAPTQQDADSSVPAPTTTTVEQAQASQPDAVPVPVRKAKPRKHKRKRLRLRDGLHVHTEAAMSGGAMLGYRERPRDLAVLGLSTLIEPSLVAGPWMLAIPVELSRRQTLPDDLVENRASAMLQADCEIAKPVSAQARGSIVLRDRPGWPDLYQPTPDGLLPTDRYSSLTRRVGGGLAVRPARKHWMRLDYDYRLTNFTDDPAFEAVARPNHLTPFDYERHDLEVDYHVRIGRVRAGVGAQAYWKSSFFVFARDANTGFTHAGPGGRAANPLEELRGISPFVEAEVELVRKHLTLELRYAHAFQEDSFQGYYSWTAPNPRVGMRASPVRRLELSLAGELWLRTSGSGGYSAGIGHPALDDGYRRRDNRFALKLDGLLRVHPSVAFTFAASYALRDTSFPDYEPGVFPASQAYDIAWDYTNLRIEAGLTLRKNWL